jgi:3'-phosphoadenosine 5'-phosphosulfate sulfotransferase (PAPS reductase)/FAD synthetase
MFSPTRRRLVSFSCGAASAVAAMLTLKKYPNVELVNAFVAEEHPDNQRFLRDCESWLGKKITQVRDDKYGASAYEIFRRERFIKSRHGASCSRILKRDQIEKIAQPDDVAVIGYTVEEQDRADRFIDANNTAVEFPLIDAELKKADCLALVERAGIALPAMYMEGYNNANCIGCPKGGKGYWNKIRRDYPGRFEEIATIQDMLGDGSYFWPDKSGKRISLRQLDPNAGRHDEPEIECGFACLMAEEKMTCTD